MIFNTFGFGKQIHRQRPAAAASWVPTDLGSRLPAWWDTSDTSSITHSGGAASQLDDLTGNGRHLTQGSGASQPTTNSRTKNSLNVLDCDGNDCMENTSFPIPASGNFALLGVAIVDTTSFFYDCLSSMNSSGYDWEFAAKVAGQFQGELNNSYGGNINLGANYIGAWHSWGIIFDWDGLMGGGGQDLYLYLDGNLITTGAGAYGSLTPQRLDTTQHLRIMAARGGVAGAPIGAFGEHIPINDPVPADVTNAFSYLNVKWAI